MNEFTLTVVGAGVIGASIGLALRQHADAPRLVIHDKELSHSQAAVKRGAFDKAEWNLINACEQADLIILAMPLEAIGPTLEAIAPYLKQDVVVSDTTRHTTTSLQLAQQYLPDSAHFISGDPLVHPSGSGLPHARAALFAGRPYCLTPSPDASETAIQTMTGFVRLLEAEPFFVGATEHDGLMTAVENLPVLLSIALLETVAGQSAWRERRKFAGNIFELVSAGAAGDPAALQEALFADRETLLQWLDLYLNQLQRWRDRLADQAADDSETVGQQIDRAVVARRQWLQDFEGGRFSDPELAPPNVDSPGFFKQWLGLGR